MLAAACRRGGPKQLMLESLRGLGEDEQGRLTVTIVVALAVMQLKKQPEGGALHMRCPARLFLALVLCLALSLSGVFVGVPTA
jgi:hypothetical protein